MKEITSSFVRLCELLKDYNKESKERYQPMIAAELQAIRWQVQKRHSIRSADNPTNQGMTRNAITILQQRARIESYFCTAKLALKHLDMNDSERVQEELFLDEQRDLILQKVPSLPLLAFHEQEDLLHDLIDDAAEQYMLQANHAVQHTLKNNLPG